MKKILCTELFFAENISNAHIYICFSRFLLKFTIFALMSLFLPCHRFSITACLLVFLCGSLFAQGTTPPPKGLTFDEYLKSLENPAAPPVTTPQAEQKQPDPVPQPATKPAATYETFLENIEMLANSLLPEIERLDSLKAVENVETPAPRDEFEKQAEYEKRIATYEKARQQKIANLEQEYRERTKETADKIKNSIASKEDLQPDWAGMLKKDATNIEEYKERANQLTEKIAKMEVKITLVGDLLGKLNFNQNETKTFSGHWQRKNLLYISRLERARELMQDYVIQEQAKILATEKNKVEMSLGSYNPENEEFEITMNDSKSQTTPFDFSGTIKISPAQAKETNRQTDDFTANVDYINYPFITSKATFYPGVKKARVYYKNQELSTTGSFKSVQGLANMPGYTQWMLYADSLISGKLAPRNLDSMYAMSTKVPKIANNISSDGSSFWTAKNTICVVTFALSATSLGLGIWQNANVDSNGKKMNSRYKEAANAYKQGSSDYKKNYSAYQKSIDDVNTSRNLRTGFYIGAGVLGAAGIATIFFF